MACYLATLIKFQSTLPREERPVRRYSLPLISVNFNPRSHERSDNIQNLTFALTKRFQSTLPREERRIMNQLRIMTVRFQSTLPREERPSHTMTITQGGISIHAPTRGATLAAVINASFELFQSTLPREERQRFLIASTYIMNFNPRSHERSDSQRVKRYS